MNKKQTVAFAMFAMVFGVAISPLIAANNAEARPDDIRYSMYGDLSAPNGKQLPGGSKVGTYSLSVKDEIITIYASLDKRPTNGMVYEGWLADIDSGETLSIGKFKEEMKRGFFNTQPAFNYDILLITEEPIGESGHLPNKVVAVVPLNGPFGQ